MALKRWGGIPEMMGTPNTAPRVEAVETSLAEAGQRLDRLTNSWFRIVEAEPLPEVSAVREWSERIEKDPLLRYPHLKILRVLLNQWDDSKQRFASVGWNELHRHARVGKSGDYVAWLRLRNYVRIRRAGRRVRVRMRRC